MVLIERLSRSGSLLPLLAALVVGGLILAGGLDRRVGRRPAGGPEPVERPDWAVEHAQALRGRFKQKSQVVRELLAGRLTLLEAAARFRALDHAPPPFNWEMFREVHRGDSDEERHCREVIVGVEAELIDSDPCLCLAICEQLERELQQHLERGPLRLPDVDDR
jgi:hypothetical protein